MQRIAVNGVPRSGSTLVSQLVTGVLDVMMPGVEVIRTHPAISYDKPVDYTFITTRHPFDVAASRYRVRLSRGPDTGGKAGLAAEMVVMAQHYEGLKSLYQMPHTLLKYERFYCYYEIIFLAIEIALNIRIPEGLKAELSEKYSLTANKHRADQLDNFLTHDDELIHGDHIGGVHPGSWKETLPKELQAQMINYCQGISEEHGYA
jgi:hypothetical protein